MSADEYTSSLVRAAHEAAARLAAMQEGGNSSHPTSAQPHRDDESERRERAFGEHLKSVGPASWISIPFEDWWR
jgi:hypothetical protein